MVDFFLLGLTLYKAVLFRRMFTDNGANCGSKLFDLLVRDQVLYFVGYASHPLHIIITCD